MAGSSPTTHASRPGSITYAWPGLYVLLRAVFVGDVQRARDDDADVMQLSVPATGLMHSDHLQPGGQALPLQFTVLNPEPEGWARTSRWKVSRPPRWL